MSKYRKKPVVIDAFRFGIDPKPDWFLEAILNGVAKCHTSGECSGRYKDIELWCTIETLEGTHQVNWSDYIIKGIKGELYPCKPDIFEATYEKVTNE